MFVGVLFDELFLEELLFDELLNGVKMVMD